MPSPSTPAARYRLRASMCVVGLGAIGCAASAQTVVTTPTTVLNGDEIGDGAIVDNTTLTIDFGGTVRPFLQYRGNATVIDNGLILGDVTTDTSIAGPHTLNLEIANNLFGNVFLSTDPTFGGNDTVTLQAGSVFARSVFQSGVQSQFNFGTGDDLLVLDGDGMEDGFFVFSGVSNLEQLRVEGDSLWVIDRGVSLDNGFQVDDNATASWFSGTIEGDVTLDPGSLFTGSFVTVDGNVTADGTIGTERADFPLTITGDLTVNNTAGAGVTAVVTAEGNAGTVDVNGNLTLNGGTLDIVETVGLYPDSSTITVINVDGTITGNFANATNRLGFLTPTATVNNADGTVSVSLVRNNAGFATVAQTDNQDKVARVLEVFDAAAGAGSDPRFLADSYNALTTDPERRAALDRLSGEALGSAPRVATQALRGFGRGLDRRARMMHVFLAEGDVLPAPRLASRGGLTHDLALLAAAAQAHPGQIRELDAFTPGFWVDVLGGTGDLDGDSGADVDYDYYGLLGGFDFAVSEEWILGMSVGYTDGSYDVDGLGSDGDLDTINLGFYTAATHRQWRFNGSINFGFDDYDTSRAVVVGGFNRTASADFEGDTISLDGTLTYQYDLENGVRLEPFVTAEYFRSETDDYAESGAGAANLTVGESDFEAFYTTLGARAHKSFRFDEFALTPEVRGGWQHEWLDHEAGFNARFLSAGFGAPIRIVAADSDDDAALLGAGLTADFNRKWSLRFDYDTRLSSDATDHQFTLALRVPW